MEELEKIKKRTKLYKILMIISIIIFIIVLIFCIKNILEEKSYHHGPIGCTLGNGVELFNSKFEAFEGRQRRSYSKSTD